MFIGKLWNKMVDFVAPVSETEELLFEDELKKTNRSAVNMRLETAETVAAATAVDQRMVVGGSPLQAPTTTSAPRLKLHSNKAKSLQIQVYIPACFDNVAEVADAIKAGRAAIVNYERIAPEEQRRICDFMNGVTYVMDGSVRRITEELVLYVPDGVSVDARMTGF